MPILGWRNGKKMYIFNVMLNLDKYVTERGPADRLGFGVFAIVAVVTVSVLVFGL